MRWLVVLLLSAGLARAEGEPAGAFDYYVLSLSWSPTWCALEGDARDAPQCDPAADAGWSLHGLWPQNERGWPSYCLTAARDPSLRRYAIDLRRLRGENLYLLLQRDGCEHADPLDAQTISLAALGAIALAHIDPESRVDGLLPWMTKRLRN